MTEPDPEEITRRINTTDAGSVVAAAGCGKTEQIARAVKALSAEGSASKRCLILTHTFAGVDVLRKRLAKLDVQSSSYQLDTIASWCLRYAIAYPTTSGIVVKTPVSNKDWAEVYPATVRLIRSGCVDTVLTASYSRVFVDEYQDCNSDQHEFVVELKKQLPICIFGDPLQSIFDFAGAIDWDTVVTSEFPEIVKLTTPWRWRKDEANAELGERLTRIREQLEAGRELDFTTDADGISRLWLPNQIGPRINAIGKTCRDTMKLDGRLVVIAQGNSDGPRAAIAKPLSQQKFSVIEPITSKTLSSQAKKITEADDGDRLDTVIAFLKKCMTGVTADFKTAVASKRNGGKAGRAKYGDLIDVGDRVDQPGGADHILELILGFTERADTYLYRRELLATMVAGLRTVRTSGDTLVDAIADVQTRTRRLGRHIPRRSVGSTLLVKGLEVEHVVIVEYEGMTREDWYVALTRATNSVIVLSASTRISPAAG